MRFRRKKKKYVLANWGRFAFEEWLTKARDAQVLPFGWELRLLSHDQAKQEREDAKLVARLMPHIRNELSSRAAVVSDNEVVVNINGTVYGVDHDALAAEIRNMMVASRKRTHLSLVRWRLGRLRVSITWRR